MVPIGARWAEVVITLPTLPPAPAARNAAGRRRSPETRRAAGDDVPEAPGRAPAASGWTSTEPASQPPSRGRGKPRWSVAGQAAPARASMAALPGPGRKVGVGPPFAARGPSLGSPSSRGPGQLASPGRVTLLTGPAVTFWQAGAGSARIAPATRPPATPFAPSGNETGPRRLPEKVEYSTSVVLLESANSAPPLPPLAGIEGSPPVSPPAPARLAAKVLVEIETAAPKT